MNDTKTDSLYGGNDTPAEVVNRTIDDDDLRGRVEALLATVGAIDENEAKVLRKRWDAHKKHAPQQVGETHAPQPAQPAQSNGADIAAADVTTNAANAANIDVNANHVNDINNAPAQSAQSEPAAAASLDDLFTQLRRRVDMQVAHRVKQIRDVEENLTRLKACFEEDSVNVKEAQQLEQRVTKGIKRIGNLPTDQHNALIAKLDAMRPQLRQLTSWRKWSTTQARETVIAEIQKIHNSGMSYAQIAQRIRQARKEWQQWDVAGEGGDQKLYEKFDKACTDAYLPCQQYFDEQDALNRENTAAREKICVLLEDAFEKIEWRNPNWKEMQHVVRTQMREWRACGMADFKNRRAIQQRFNAIIEKFDDRLGRERRRCLKVREKLISDIHQLSGLPDTAAALTELSALKKQWTPTVTMSRGKEQMLWSRFSNACDKIYQRRNRERDDLMRTLKTNLATREAFCAKIEARARGEIGDEAVVVDVKSTDNTQTAAEAKGEPQTETIGESKGEMRGEMKAVAATADTVAAQTESPATDTPAAESKPAAAAEKSESKPESKPAADDNLRASLKRWDEHWSALGEVPKGDEKGINERYRHAVAQIEKLLAVADAKSQSQQQEILRQKSQLCAEIETRALAGDADTDAQQTLTAKWDKLGDKLEKLPAKIEKRIDARYRAAIAALAGGGALQKLKDGTAKNLESLHEKILQLEIMLELDSPPEFSRQRLALQVGRLSAAMGKADADGGQSVERVITDILVCGAIDVADRKVVDARFEKCLKQVGK